MLARTLPHFSWTCETGAMDQVEAVDEGEHIVSFFLLRFCWRETDEA